jgi:hypothetical protein
VYPSHAASSFVFNGYSYWEKHAVTYTQGGGVAYDFKAAEQVRGVRPLQRGGQGRRGGGGAIAAGPKDPSYFTLSHASVCAHCQPTDLSH